MTEPTAISVYPVGLLLHVRKLWFRRRAGQPLALRWHVEQFRRDWRRKSYWNGFLAEVDYPPAGLTHTRCGKGWTRRRAARDLGYQLWKDNQR